MSLKSILSTVLNTIACSVGVVAVGGLICAVIDLMIRFPWVSGTLILLTIGFLLQYLIKEVRKERKHDRRVQGQGRQDS